MRIKYKKKNEVRQIKDDNFAISTYNEFYLSLKNHSASHFSTLKWGDLHFSYLTKVSLSAYGVLQLEVFLNYLLYTSICAL